MNSLALILSAAMLGYGLAHPLYAAVYRLTDPQGGVNCIEWDGLSPYVPPTGWGLTVSPQCAPTPAAGLVLLTRTQFMHRFTASELTAISAAARTNDTINLWLITAQATDRIDLTDPVLKQGLDALVAAGILTTDREAQIMAQP